LDLGPVSTRPNGAKERDGPTMNDHEGIGTFASHCHPPHADAMTDLQSAGRWDHFRTEFHLPPGQIYLDGNSLGLLSQRSEAAVLRVLAQWSAQGIGGWEESGWIDLPERLAGDIAPLIGATPRSVGLMAQTTANLHQLLATLYDPTRTERLAIVADEINFASDAHALASHLRLRGVDPTTQLRWVQSRDGFTLRTEDMLAALTEDVQLLVLPSVLYVSGQLLDVSHITRTARERGMLIGWDLSHSIGAVPHTLEADGADFAFWCNYKYLNAGPGAVGGLFLHPRHHERLPGMAGWWGVDPAQRFELVNQHTPATGASRLHVGTPPILSLAPLAGSLEMFAEAGGVEAVRTRSLQLTQHLLDRSEQELAALGVSIVTPRAPEERGGHIALCHPEAGRICAALRGAGVVPDFRRPAVLLLAPIPFYATRSEVDVAIDRLTEILTTKSYLQWPDPVGATP